MTTPGGVPNLPAGALTLETLQSKLQDMTTAAQRQRAADRVPAIFNGSTAGNLMSDLSPGGIIAQLFAGFQSFVANADPADIKGPEDLPPLLLEFIESLPFVGELVGLLEAITGTYDGDDPVLVEIQKIFKAIRDFFGILTFLDQDVEVVWQGIANTFLSGKFAIPADVQASINTALGNMKDALDGTYTGSGPIFLAIKAAAAQWLTGTSPVITSIQGDATSAKNNWASLLSGMSQSSIGALVSDLLGTKSTATGAASDAAAAVSDAAAAQGNWTSWLSGGSWGSIGDSVADFLGTKETANTADATATTAQSTARSTITQLFNKLGGNNAGSATLAQASATMQALANTVSAQGAAINSLQNMLEGANGFSASVPFREPETVMFDVAGGFSYAVPSWFNTATDFIDAIVCGGGSGGGGGLSDSSSPGVDSVFRANGVTKVTGTGGASVGPGPGGGIGASPGNQMYLDILYEGGAGGTNTKDGTQPGGGGGGGNFFGVIGKGGNAGAWGTTTLGPGATTAPFTGTVGAGGAGTAGGFSPGRGGDGCAWVRARAAMPSSFTSMGNIPSLSGGAGALTIPLYRLNTGITLTDAMTAGAIWGRVPPSGATGGHVIAIRASTNFSHFVYLRLWYGSGTTNYELGRVVANVRATPWRTGTILGAIPLNAFSLAVDDTRIFTIMINGTSFDSYSDVVAASSAMGQLYRSGGWGSSESALPGSIQQFFLFDSGTPSRMTSNTIATQVATNSATYTDLTGSVGPSVTIMVPQSGDVVIDVSCDMATTAITNQKGFMGFALSGSNTQAADDTKCANGAWAGNAGLGGTLSNRIPIGGLTPGTTTFTAKYKSSSGNINFSNRRLTVEPRP